MKAHGQLIEIVKKHRPFWVVCGLLFLANVLFYLFFISAESREIGRLQSRFQAERKKVSEQRKRQAEIDQYQTLQQTWRAFEDSLPGKIQFPERIQQLKKILNRYNLAAEDLAFRSEPMKDGSLVRFATTFQTSGPYDDCKRFIGELQAMPGLLCIHHLEFRQADAGRTLEMDLELSAYFRNDNQTPKP